jgi:uncharacterized protein YeaO (DUF488 family)
MIKTKRWNDPAEPSDGTRILITRYRPRGLPKSETWNEYRIRYLKEMREQKTAIEVLAKRSKAGETITLLCSKDCVQEARCHRSLLKELIERAEQNLTA